MIYAHHVPQHAAAERLAHWWTRLPPAPAAVAV